MMNPQVTVWLMVIASTFFWGSNFNAGHAIANDVAPLTAAADRFGVAVILFCYCVLFKAKPNPGCNGKMRKR